MNHNEYTSSVDSGIWPSLPNVPLDKPYVDERGVIQNLLLKPITSVAVINSEPGTVRANHYHKTDWHYAYVISGEILYFERDVGSNVIPDPFIFKAGDMFFTPPMREHAMLFKQRTQFLTFAKNVRSHESHESDLVRVNFIDMLNSKTYL